MSLNTPAVYVVDDELAVRDSLAALVGSHGHRVELFESAEQFLAGHDRDSPGCLIVDYRMNGLSGTELLRILHDDGCHMPVILMTAYATVPLAVQAMEMGALTVLEKPCRREELWQCIDKALQLDSRYYTARVRTNDARRRLATLGEDEMAVLDRIVAGQQNKTIAHELGIGLRTVEARRQSVFHKLGADSLAQLLRLVLDGRVKSNAYEADAETSSTGG